MTVNRDEFLELALRGYEGSYDIERMQPEENDLSIAAKAALHVSESGFVLSRKAEMWSANSDEYVTFYSVSSLTDQIVEQGIQSAYEEGMSQIDLTKNRNHMCTRLVAVFLCDEADDAALSRVKECRLYKSFQMSLKGWMEFHAVAVDLGKKSVVSNRYGRETAKFLNTVLNPEKRKKNRKIWGILKEMLQ